MTPGIFDGRALALVVLIIAALVTWLATRNRTRLASAAATHVVDAPLAAASECAVRGCHYPAFWVVTRRGTNGRERVCQGCYDEGTAWGWWA